MVDDETQDVAAGPAGAPVNRDARRDPVVIEGEIAARDGDEGEAASAAAAESPADPSSAERPPESSSAPSEDAAVQPGAAAVKPVRAGARGFAAGALAGIIVSALAAAVSYSFQPSQDDLAASAKRLAVLEAQAERANTALSGETERESAALAAIEKRLAALESGAGTSNTGDIDKRVAALEATNGDGATKAAAAADASQRLATQVADLRAETEAARGDVQSLSGRVGKLETAASQAAGAGGDLAALAARVDKDEAALAAPKPEPPAVDSAIAIALIAGAMEAKLAKGTPLAPELAALERLGVDPAELKPLEAVTNGAPTGAALAASFAAVAPQVLAATARGDSGGVVDRFLAHMHSLVRVRDLNETPSADEDPQALVAEIEAASRRDDIARALAAFGKLPDAARQAAGDWPREADARRAADAALAAIRGAAIGRLAGGVKP